MGACGSGCCSRASYRAAPTSVAVTLPAVAYPLRALLRASAGGTLLGATPLAMATCRMDAPDSTACPIASSRAARTSSPVVANCSMTATMS